MLFSCYLLQLDFKDPTPLAPTALPLGLLIHARRLRRGNHAAPRIAHARRDGSSSACTVSASSQCKCPSRRVVPPGGSISPDAGAIVRHTHACGGTRERRYHGEFIEPAVLTESQSRRIAQSTVCQN